MAAIKGRDGQISLGAKASTIAYIDTWSISFSSDKDEITAFGDDWHKYIQTIQGATGQASGTRDTAATGQTTILALFCSGGTVATQSMWLQEESANVFTVSVLIDSIDIGVPVNGKETFSIGFTVNARPGHN